MLEFHVGISLNLTKRTVFRNIQNTGILKIISVLVNIRFSKFVSSSYGANILP